MNKSDLESTLRILAESISVITTDKNSILGAKALATAMYSNENYNVSATQDFMACLYNIRWAQDLRDIDSKYGWKTSLFKALVPALSVFYKVNGFYLGDALVMINGIYGLTTLVTPIVVTMIQANRGLLSFYELKRFRDLLAKDLLEINDKFFEFMSKLDSTYEQDDYDDNEIETRSEPEGNGSEPFSDLLKLL